jgi:hypothetical protein
VRRDSVFIERPSHDPATPRRMSCTTRGAPDILGCRNDREEQMAQRKLSPEQREQVRKNAKEKIAAGTSTAEVTKAIAEKYGITRVSARNYLPDGARGKKANAKANRKVSKKARRKPVSGKAAKSRLTANKSPRSAAGRTRKGSRLIQVVARLSEQELKKALGAKRLWSQREQLLGRKREVERELQQIDGRVRKLNTRINRITVG